MSCKSRLTDTLGISPLLKENGWISTQYKEAQLLDVGGKVGGELTLSPGQLTRKETPPLQQATGQDEPEGGGDVTDDLFPCQSPKLSLSSPPTFQPYISALHPNTAHARLHRQHTRGPVSA